MRVNRRFISDLIGFAITWNNESDDKRSNQKEKQQRGSKKMIARKNEAEKRRENAGM